MFWLEKESILILCVDRDNDLGKKANITGPIIGREENLKAATKLALADPAESDANCIFAAVKKFDELKKEYSGLKIATITGHSKSGFPSDKKLNEQLDLLEEKFNPEGFILVTDGGEDDQILPLLQSRKRIISKEVVIVKQAQQVESVYYTIREALKDPYLARIVFGIPGTILVFYALTLIYNMQNLFIQGVAFIIGAYLLIKGLGIELKLHQFYGKVVSSISLQRASFPLYLGSIFFFFFALITLVSNLPVTAEEPIQNYLGAIQGIYFGLTIAALCVVTGRGIDAIQLKKAISLRKYFLYGVSTIIVWFLLDSGTLVLLGEAVVDFFWLAIAVSLAVIVIAFKLTEMLDVRTKLTELLLDLPVYNKKGIWLGKIKKVDKRSNAIVYAKGQKEEKTAKKGNFTLQKGKVVLSG